MSDNFLQAPSPEHLAGLLPQYGIGSFIAQGGMGAVYKATQLSLDRDVAIKVLLYEFGGDAEFRESFTTEAKAMARLNHPNLLGVFDYGDIDGMPYIVMEYVHGGSLHEAAWNNAIEPTAAVAIVKGICDGLAHAHQNGIVHRDIKASNILLTLNAEPKIADFGLAHAADSEKPGLVMGTPGYTAPEVFQNPLQAGELADIYSVGVILHQILTGIDPAGSMEPPSRPTGSLRLDGIWRKATHTNPAQRYQSVAAMASDLEKWAAAKRKAPVANVAAPFRPATRKLQTTATTGGGGVFAKLLIMAILAGLLVFTYRHFQERKSEINQAIAEANDGVGNAEPPAPRREPAPISRLPEQIEPPPVSDSDLVEVGVREMPIIPPVVDSEPEPEPGPEPVEFPPGDPELRERAIGLILEAREKRDSGLAENARALLSQLDSRARRATAGEAILIRTLREDIVDGRIPLTDDVPDLSGSLARDFENARSKEASIDQSYHIDLARIREAYVARLEAAAEETSGDETNRRLLAQAERAKDLVAWIGLLAPEPERGAKGSDGFAGNWDIQTPGNTSRWIAHPNGRMEIVGEIWEVSWTIEEDGTLEVHWPDKRPYKLTLDEDGRGWTGRTSYGKKATLTRGDW